MRFYLAFGLALLACSQPADINGTYDGAMTRSQGCGDPPPASASAQVQIVDSASEHVGHILGALTCDFDFTVTDYGGVGNVTDVRPGCAFQPPGMTLASGLSEFGPKLITFQWTGPAGDAGAGDGGVSSCHVTDTWTLSR